MSSVPESHAKQVENKNHHIDELFKRGTEHYAVRPSKDLWDRISAELDATPVKKRFSALTLRYAAAMLVFIGFFITQSPESQSFEPMAQNSAESTIGTNTPVDALSTVQSLPVAAFVTSPSVTPKLNTREPDGSSEGIMVLAAQQSIKTPAQEEYIYLPMVPEDEAFVASNMDIYSQLFDTDDPVEVMGFEAFDEDAEDLVGAFKSAPTFKAQYRELDMRGFYLGVAGSYNQVSVLEYGNQFQGTRPIQPSLKFGSSRSIRVGYNFNNSFGVEAEYVYNAQQGQNYVMSEDDEIVQKTLSLTYDLIPVVAKLKVGRISQLTNQPVVMNYIAGVQYGMLRDARLPQDKRYEETTEDLFKHNDVSMVLGLEYDVHVQDNIIISAGARGTFSNDISTHLEPLDNYAKRNFTFGLRAGVSYLLR